MADLTKNIENLTAEQASLLTSIQSPSSGTGLIGPTLTVTGTTAGAVNLGDTTALQLTSNSTAVTSNNPTGVITSFGAYTTAGATAATTFRVNCSACASTSVVSAQIVAYGAVQATNGFPYVAVTSITSGSFTLQVINLHASNALAGALLIGYSVL